MKHEHAFNDLTAAEQATVDLVTEVVESGDTRPLVTLLEGGDAEHGQAREALRTIAEWDSEVLVQVALQALGRQANGGRRLNGASSD
jgi:hypothetical protein